MKNEKKEVTEKDIRSWNVNYDIAKEAFNQSHIRTKDLLDVKDKSDTKAFTLLSIYITLIIGLLTVGNIFSEKIEKISIIYLFVIPAISLFFGTIMLFISLLSSKYAYLGSTPKMWLKKEIMEGDNNTLAKLLVELTYFYKKRICQSIKSNRKKLIFIDIGIIFGLFSILSCVSRIFMSKTSSVYTPLIFFKKIVVEIFTFPSWIIWGILLLVIVIFVCHKYKLLKKLFKVNKL
ncbi:MAG TPA: hypothetical protein VMW66_02185 [Elusimicrobiales bacterium]|nr:hypothetical protein [Elusimicrobiales bacterium]